MGKRKMVLPYSKFNGQILQILQEEGYISHWHWKRDEEKGNLWVMEVYGKKNSYLPHMHWEITQISKSSRPFYISAGSLWKVDGGLSTYILSTSRGLMTDREARKYGLGGELICKIK